MSPFNNNNKAKARNGLKLSLFRDFSEKIVSAISHSNNAKDLFVFLSNPIHIHDKNIFDDEIPTCKIKLALQNIKQMF